MRLVFEPIDLAGLEILRRQMQPPIVAFERADGRECHLAGRSRAIELLLAGEHIDRPRAVEETHHPIDALAALLEGPLARQEFVVGDLREIGDGLVQRIHRRVEFRGLDVQADLLLQGRNGLPFGTALLGLLLDGGVDEALVQLGRVRRGVLRQAADPAHRAGDLRAPQQLIGRAAAGVPAARQHPVTGVLADPIEMGEQRIDKLVGGRREVVAFAKEDVIDPLDRSGTAALPISRATIGAKRLLRPAAISISLRQCSDTRASGREDNQDTSSEEAIRSVMRSRRSSNAAISLRSR